MERVEDLLGRTDIVHDHFKELFTDPLHKETPEWIWRRWRGKRCRPCRSSTARGSPRDNEVLRDGVAQIGGLHPFRCNVVAVGDGGRGFRGLVLQRNEVRDLREH